MPHIILNKKKIEFDTEEEKDNFLDELVQTLREENYYVSSISYDLPDSNPVELPNMNGDIFTEQVRMVGDYKAWTVEHDNIYLNYPQGS